MNNYNILLLWRNKKKCKYFSTGAIVQYLIRPAHRFSKLLGTLICGKMCIYLLRIHYKKGLI